MVDGTKMYTSSSDALHVEQRDAQLWIRFNRPTLNYAMLEALTTCVLEATHDDQIRALIVNVSADGDDGNDMGPWPDRLRHRQPRGTHGAGPVVEQDTVRALRRFMKPTVALMENVVNGLAIDLAAACDIRVASVSTTLTDSRIHQGRTASTGIAYMLPKLIGQSQAMRILLLGETLSAAELRRIHFVHEVVEDGEFAEHARTLANQIATMATRAWEVHKMQVVPQLDLGFDAAMVHSLGIRQTHVIEDRAEGMRAWREKRDPEFTGR